MASFSTPVCPRCGGFRVTIDQLDGWTSSVCINCGHTVDAPRQPPPGVPMGSGSYCVRCKGTTPHRTNVPLSSQTATLRGRPVTHWRKPIICSRCGTRKSVFVPAPRSAEAMRA